jgi:RimJ/RimL family protein N-acetyltransferase
MSERGTAAMRVVDTARLTLEPQTAEHAEAMFAVLSDPAIYEFENAPPRSLEWLCERFAKLESRTSSDGSEAWLNWVMRTETDELIGYVQATVHSTGRAAIAYEMASSHWGQGLAREAVEAMMAELATHYAVRSFSAVLKRANHRSLRFLERLGFELASAEQRAEWGAEPDELALYREVA